MEVRAIQKDRELEIKREGESKERYRVREIKGGSGMSKGRERKSIIKRERERERERERLGGRKSERKCFFSCLSQRRCRYRNWRLRQFCFKVKCRQVKTGRILCTEAAIEKVISKGNKQTHRVEANEQMQ